MILGRDDVLRFRKARRKSKEKAGFAARDKGVQ